MLKVTARSIAFVVALATVTHALATDRLVPAQFGTIQSAIDAAVAGDTVLVSPGAYNERLNMNGKAITLKGVKGYTQTILDPLAGGGRLVTCITSETLSTVIEGFTFRNSPTGGLYMTSAALTIKNCRFIGNTAAQGPAMWLQSANISIDNCQFIANIANDRGGVIYALSSTVKINNCTFNNNKSTGTRGGVIYAESTVFDVDSTKFLGNREEAGDESYGGTLYLQTCSGTFDLCTWSDNVASSNLRSFGGSMFMDGSSPIFHSCSFTNCSAFTSRGGYYNPESEAHGGSVYLINASSPSFYDCQWSGSKAETTGNFATTSALRSRGGAMYVRNNSNAQLYRCVFNTTVAKSVGTNYAVCNAYGGALWVNRSNLYMEDCAFLNCFANDDATGIIGWSNESFGGAMWMEDLASPTILRTRFEGCTAEYGGALYMTSQSSPFISDASFINNTGSIQGGVMYSQHSMANFATTLFQGNNSPSGSVAFTTSSDSYYYPTFVNSLFCGNLGTDIVGSSYGWDDEDNINTVLDTCPEDCNANGFNDLWEIEVGLANDCNNNLTPDSCDITANPASDCNRDGIIDSCQASGSSDCDGNGVLDACETDCNQDGVADVCQIRSGLLSDCNHNGIPDSCDITSGLETDCDQNQIPDSCQSDCDHDGTPDVCEIAAGAADCNNNSIPDSCEIAGGAIDFNNDGILDSCQSSEFVGLITEIVPITFQDASIPTGAVCYRVWAKMAHSDSRLYGFYGNGDGEMRISAVGGFFQSADGGNLSSDMLCDATGVNMFDSWLTVGSTCKDNNNVQQTGMNFTAFNSGGGIQSVNGIVFVTPEQPQSVAGSSERILLMQLTTRQAVAVTGQLNLLGENRDGSNWEAFQQAIPAPTLVDCNSNGVHDALDIAAGTSMDCDRNGVPDECGIATDCNSNGINDSCDIASGLSADINSNGRPDECECMGDIDGDLQVDVNDIIEVLLTWGDLGATPADLDSNGIVDTGDLALVLLYFGGCQ